MELLAVSSEREFALSDEDPCLLLVRKCLQWQTGTSRLVKGVGYKPCRMLAGVFTVDFGGDDT